MAKRLFDCIFSLLVLLIVLPLCLGVAVCLKLSSKGPVFYIAKRAGLGGQPFSLFKFRTMHVGADKGSAVTGQNDSRVFLLGKFLRLTKLDELPQLLNVLKGDMSVVGPRPEDMNIVERYYVVPEYMATLSVRPGMVSPGSLFHYTHSHHYIDDEQPESSYVRLFLPVKLALERVYLERQTLWYDVLIICRTIRVIACIALGQREFRLPDEYFTAEEQGFMRQTTNNRDQ